MRWIVNECGRWARAVAAPGAALGVAVWLGPAASRLQDALPGGQVRAAWLALVGGAALWLAAAASAAAVRPRRDRRAAEHLQDMRVRAGLPQSALLCILRILWVTPAGTHVAAVDVRTGAPHELWLSEVDVQLASYVLIAIRHDTWHVLDVAPPSRVAAAKRYEHRQPRTWTEAMSRARREHRAARDVVRAAEVLLRRG